MTFIKFCGITNYEDAKSALDLGVDALGFNFLKTSPRYINPIEAKIITRKLPAKAWIVGVFVNSTREEINQIARAVSLDTIQLHGDESQEFCKNWDELRVIKALRLAKGEADFKPFIKVSDYLLLDSYSAKLYGGTGKEIEADLLEVIPKELFSKIFLSGGLNPENIKEKVQKYKPFAVDVASGIEISPGKKSKEKMQEFIKAIR